MSESEYSTVGRLAREVTTASGKRTTPRMIHNYESKGLIETPRRSSGGTRLYPEGSVERIALIKELQRDHDLSLTAIRRLLEKSTLKQDVQGVAESLGAPAIDPELMATRKRRCQKVTTDRTVILVPVNGPEGG